MFLVVDKKASLTINKEDFDGLFGSVGTDVMTKASKVVFKRSLNQEEIKTLFDGIKSSDRFTAKIWRKRSFAKSYQVGTAELEITRLIVTFSTNTSTAKIDVDMSQISGGDSLEF
jgi:hypothetical protein